LTEVPNVIGTGGIFVHNPYAGRVMAAAVAVNGASGVLRPTRAQVRLDQDYVMYAVGLLADSHPAAALQIFRDHVLPDESEPHKHAEGHAAEHGHPCCC
jgi:hypothetical protein